MPSNLLAMLIRLAHALNHHIVHMSQWDLMLCSIVVPPWSVLKWFSHSWLIRPHMVISHDESEAKQPSGQSGGWSEHLWLLYIHVSIRPKAICNSLLLYWINNWPSSENSGISLVIYLSQSGNWASTSEGWSICDHYMTMYPSVAAPFPTNYYCIK
jgi:hypothetical protein